MDKIGRLVHELSIPLLFLGLSLYFLASIVLEKGYSLTAEDNLFENLTAVFYLSGAAFCLIGFAVTHRHDHALSKYPLLGWAILFLFLGMEEISWGQRVFGIETPDFFLSRNLQKETNLHNIASTDFNRLFYASTFLIGVALPGFMLLRTRLGNTLLLRYVPKPEPQLIVPFALAFTFAAPEWIAFAPEYWGLLVAAALGMVVLLLKTDDIKETPVPTDIRKPLLAIGLGGVSLIILVMFLFQDNIGHINQPSEIKEFLFSACFLVFAYNAGGLSGVFTNLVRK